MTTPIADFVRSYADRGVIRFHMPGHKGKPILGCESMDLTEVEGADVLSSAKGIIAESEANATALFGSAHTFYSTEGSTLCIKAMLALTIAGRGERPWILAARNAHKALIYAAALLDLRIRWLDGKENTHLCRCEVTAEDVEEALAHMTEPPAAVYLTSPDYLGNLAEIRGIAEACKRHGIPLLVDNAHGAYLKFLKPSHHPLDLGAAMCCDSAHKTLPVLTGGAYLHVAKGWEEFARGARSAMALFASTSPSYLILQSLDLCNRSLAEGYEERLALCVNRLDHLKHELRGEGFSVEDTEPLKLVVSSRSVGYTGEELASYLRFWGIEAEFSDGDFLVLMATPENGEKDLSALAAALRELPEREPIPKETQPLRLRSSNASEAIRSAMFSLHESIPVAEAVGRICAAPTVSCPPAIPIAVSGDVITEEDVALFLRYGIEEIDVIR